MREFCTYGSVRGVPGNQHPYRDNEEFHAYLQRDHNYVRLTGSHLNVEKFLAEYRSEHIMMPLNENARLQHTISGRSTSFRECERALEKPQSSSC
jgi:hypothetical protein